MEELTDSRIGVLAAWIAMTLPLMIVLSIMERFVERNR